MKYYAKVVRVRLEVACVEIDSDDIKTGQEAARAERSSSPGCRKPPVCHWPICAANGWTTWPISVNWLSSRHVRWPDQP